MVDEDFAHTYVNPVDKTLWEVTFVTTDNRSVVTMVRSKGRPDVAAVASAMIRHFLMYGPGAEAQEPHRISLAQVALGVDTQAAKRFVELIGPERSRQYSEAVRGLL